MATYDVAAFQTAVPTSSLPTPQELWALDGEGRVITGVVKLVQRFLLELLTIRGSVPFAPLAGSSLLSIARAGRIRSDVDAYVFFQYAVGEIEPNLQAVETDTDPPEERFRDAEILSVTFTNTYLSYRVRITTAAGTTRELVVPLRAIP